MFCSNCGENLLSTNQKFCQNCGTEVLATSKATDYKTERIQNVTSPKPVKQPRQLQKGSPGKYSNWSLGLALISIAIGIVSLIIGINLSRIFFIFPSYNRIVRLVAMIVILLLRVGGLIMGVFSKVNSSKAEIFEPYNDVEKAGSIFGIFGILINSVGLLLSLLGPYSIFGYIYWMIR